MRIGSPRATGCVVKLALNLQKENNMIDIEARNKILMEEYSVPKELLPFVQDAAMVGSRNLCNPPVEDTDKDVILWVDLIKARLDPSLPKLHPNQIIYAVLTESKVGFEHGGSKVPGNNETFASYKKGNINLIIVEKESMFRLFMSAATLSKRFNLLNKQDRVDLHNCIMHGHNFDEPTLHVGYKEQF